MREGFEFAAFTLINSAGDPLDAWPLSHDGFMDALETSSEICAAAEEVGNHELAERRNEDQREAG